MSKMGRNKACELDNLLIEAIIMVAELNLLLKDYTAEDNGKWYPRLLTLLYFSRRRQF